jgi:hypothetical protein
MPDDKITSKFHVAFAEPLSPSGREAMRFLCPRRGHRRARAVPDIAA